METVPADLIAWADFMRFAQAGMAFSDTEAPDGEPEDPPPVAVQALLWP